MTPFRTAKRLFVICLVSAALAPSHAAEAVTGDPVVAAAGDIACDPADPSFNGGNGTATKCHMEATSAILQNLLTTTNLQKILPLGDEQYACGALQAFNGSYAPTWGQAGLKAITSPVPGDHEYITATGTRGDASCPATPGSGYYSYFGSAAGDPSKGYYSYDLGAWHIIALNSVCKYTGGCGRGSPEYTFLQADLAAHPTVCTLAYWHHPRFASSTSGGTNAVAQFWNLLYGAGAEIVLNGHHHFYERFAPQTPAQQPSPTGIQEFVVGTGGQNHAKFGPVQPNSQVRDASTFGVLTLTLHPTSYDWQFDSEAGKTFSDSGTANCH